MASTMTPPTHVDVRERLIQEAADAVARGGLEALSVRRVAEAVGTSTMAVYTHFGSKDELLGAVVQQGFDRLATALAAVPITDDPTVDLLALGDAYRRMALADANLYRVMFSRNPLGLGDPGPALDGDVPDDPGLRAFVRILDAATRVIDSGRAQGDPGTLAHALWGLVHGCVDLELAGFLTDGDRVLRALVGTTIRPD